MKGLMLGGLAGLLFGSLFSGMGILGNILGLLINFAAIAVIVMLVVKIFNMFKDKKTQRTGSYTMAQIINEQDIINAICLSQAYHKKNSTK